MQTHQIRTTTTTAPGGPDADDGPGGEEGSVVSEYGLVAVLGATIAGLAISWAKGGAIAALLGDVLSQLRAVVAG